VHELGIAQQLIEMAEDAARRQHVDRVLSVRVDIGSLSGVLPDALTFCFDACTRQTLLEGCRLEINQIAAQARCQSCAQTYALNHYFDSCPFCCAADKVVLCGEELQLREMEVD